MTVCRYLHHAARAGSLDCVRVLIWGDTAAGPAAHEGGRAAAVSIGPLSAAVDARDRWFRTPLQWAVSSFFHPYLQYSKTIKFIFKCCSQIINGHVEMTSLLVRPLLPSEPTQSFHYHLSLL